MTTPDTLNPYEQIWQSRDLKALESTPIKLNNKRPEWKKGLNAFVDEMQGTGYGLAALASQGVENVVGPNDITKGITDWGLEGYNRNMEESQAGVNAPKIARVEDVHTASDAMDWASFQLGKGLPMLASLAVPAAIGGTIARFGAKEGVAALAKSAVGDTVKKAVATKALQAAEGDVVTDAMKQAAAKALQDRIAAGAAAGGYLGSFGLEGGQSFGETVAQGVKPEDAVKSAIAVGGINGALEFLPFYSAAKSIGLGQYAKKGIMDIIKNDEGLSKMAVALATAKELGGRAVKGGVVGAGAEGITEGLQELTSIAGERWAKNDPLFADLSEDDWSRVKNSMAAGALTGGVAMGAGATLKGPKATGSTSTDENRPDASSAGGASARPKTREQEIEELRNKINTELEVAIKSGNTARAEQLAGARDMIDMGVAPPTPVQEIPRQEPPVQEPIVQEAPTQEAPTTEATPARPGEPIQLKRGEEIILTPSKPGESEARIVPTEEEKVRLQELMGERPEGKPQEGGDVKYSMPLKRPISVADVSKIAREPVNNVISNITFGNQTLVNKEENVTKRTTARGKDYNFNLYEYDLQDGRKRLVLSAGDPENYVDAGAVIRFENNKPVIEMINADDNFENLGYNLTRQIIKRFGIPIKDESGSFSEVGAKHNAKLPQAESMPVAQEATIEEFEAVRKQFQERQKQETPFKNWFGKGTKDITANADGTPITLYHGTNNPTFNQWDSSRAGNASAHPTSGLGFFMTADKGAAARYGNNLMALHAKIQNPYTLTDADLTSIETKEDANKLRKRLMAKGYDGAVVKAPGAKPYVIAFESKQVKFVTNEKPTDSPDFRYSFAGKNAKTADLMSLENAEDRTENSLLLDKQFSQQSEKVKNALLNVKKDTNNTFAVDSSNDMFGKDIYDSLISIVADKPENARKILEANRIDPDAEFLYSDYIQNNEEKIVSKYLKSLGIKYISNADNIRKETGWHKGADGKWRFEISDNDMRWKKSFDNIPESGFLKEDEKPFPLSSVMDHPKLFEAYPFLKQISVVKKQPGFKALGWFSEEDMQIGISPYSPDPRSTLLHEIQHAIQMYEGFSKGGGALTAWQNLPSDSKEFIIKNILLQLNYEALRNKDNSDILSKIEKVKAGDASTIIKEGELEHIALRLAGETEARLTQARRSMTEDERKATSPESMQDYPYRDQILTQQSDISAEQAPITRSVTPAEFRSNIDSVMEEGWLQQAEAAGIIQVVDGKGTRGEAGSWDGNTFKIYLQSMPVNGSPVGVLLHEGSHAPTFKQILGDNLEGFLSDLDKLAANGNKAAQKAIMHATIASANVLGIKHNLDMGGSKEDFANVQALIEEQKPGLLAEEKLAYFIQYGSETQSGAGFLKRLINAIKTWFAQTQLGQTLKAAGIGFELSEGMAVEWAKTSLQRSLENAQQAAQVRKQVVNEAKLMPPSVRLGRALEAAYQDDPLYSISIQEIKDSLWTNPTDSRVEMVNKPGLLQRWRADFIDFFAEIEKKSKTVYDAFTLLRNKVAARLSQSRQEYYLPLLKEIVGSKWTAKQVGDMLAARHHKVDKVNTRLAERASYGYTKELLKALPKTKRQELMEGRVNIKAGKMPDGKPYLVNGVPATMSSVTKQKLMFDLMNKYSQFEIANADGKQALREEWEIFKDAAGGFSDGGVAKGMVRTVDEVLAPASEDQARFDRIMALFDAMNRHALQIREDGGLITADEHARLLMDKSAYAPLKRESYNVNTETMRLFQQAGRGGSKNLGTRAGTAELSEPTNVLQNALALLEASAAAAERNLANQELYKVVNADKAAWKPWFHIAAKDEYVTHDEDGFLQEKNSTAVNRADIVLIKDGRKIVIRPNMHNERAMGFVRAANNLDAQELSGPMKVLGMFNNLVRAVNITFSPIFLMMNAIKDPLTAAYNLQATEGAKHTKEIFVKDYFKTYRNSFRMLKKVFMDGNRDRTDADVKWVERYENAGGRTSFIEQLKENDNTWRSFDAQVARRQGNFKHLMAVKDTWIDGIENLNILFENVMRFSTFRVLVEKGMSDTDAARIAQDLTTNFSRRGYKSQALGLWWLFFNASVQGNYQVVRNLMKSKRLQVLSLGTIAFAVMLDLLGRAIADDWDEIPEWDKERFIIIPVKVDGDYVKIPAPWVYNTLWRTGGLIGEMFSGVKEPQDALLDMAAMTATTFNPLGKPGSIAQAIAPTAADPFIQILENKDFAGNPIGPEGYPGASKKANSELLWSSTPKGYQSIARFVNEVTGGSATESGGIDLKPGDYQLLAKFLTGSMGRFLTDSTFGFAEDVKKGIEGPKDIPVIREFFSDPYDPLTVQKYHTNIASIYGAHRLERMYREGPDRDLIKLQEVRSERGEELRMYSQAQDVERQLKSLRVRLKAAQARDDVGREKQLKERMAQVQEQFNAAYRQRVN
jgi:hypothetical protein